MVDQVILPAKKDGSPPPKERESILMAGLEELVAGNMPKIIQHCILNDYLPGDRIRDPYNVSSKEIVDAILPCVSDLLPDLAKDSPELAILQRYTSLDASSGEIQIEGERLRSEIESVVAPYVNMLSRSRRYNVQAALGLPVDMPMDPETNKKPANLKDLVARVLTDTQAHPVILLLNYQRDYEGSQETAETKKLAEDLGVDEPLAELRSFLANSAPSEADLARLGVSLNKLYSYCPFQVRLDQVYRKEDQWPEAAASLV